MSNRHTFQWPEDRDEVDFHEMNQVLFAVRSCLTWFPDA